MRLADRIRAAGRALARRPNPPPYTHTLAAPDDTQINPYLTVTGPESGRDIGIFVEGPGRRRIDQQSDAQTVEHDKRYELDLCWRCNLTEIARADAVGLCEACKAVLRDLTSEPVSDEPLLSPQLRRAIADWLDAYLLGSRP